MNSESKAIVQKMTEKRLKRYGHAHRRKEEHTVIIERRGRCGNMRGRKNRQATIVRWNDAGRRAMTIMIGGWDMTT